MRRSKSLHRKWDSEEVPLARLRGAVSAGVRIARAYWGATRLADHVEPSLLLSPQRLAAGTETLGGIALAAAEYALNQPVSGLYGRGRDDEAEASNAYPGEHYRLLAGLCTQMPGLAVEIGTYTGQGTIALLETATEVVTFDVSPLLSMHRPWLEDSGSHDGRWRQEVGDLSDPAFFTAHENLLREASVIFIDGPKDGRFEAEFLRKVMSVTPAAPQIIVIDDIRLLTMISVWRDLALPKVDFTSFGHYTGTGIALRTGDVSEV